MASITQDMRYRLSLIKYAEKFGVTKAAVKYKTNRQYIYRWKRRYDGSWDSLRDRSRRPLHHPNQHTEAEIKMVLSIRRRNSHDGLVVFWVKLRQRGYSRSIPGLYRFLKKQGIMAVHPPNPKYIPKPYEKMDYPGQRIQVDVKFVPSACLKNSKVIGKHSFSTPLLRSIPDGVLWKLSRSTAPILPHSLWITLWGPFLVLLRVFRQTMARNLPIVLLLTGTNPRSSRNTWKCTAFTTKSSGPLLPATMGRWNAATGRTMSSFMQPTCFIPLRTSQNS